MAAGIDLGIAGRVALVCGSSGGLGNACAVALAESGAHVFLNGRSEEALKRAASELRERTGAQVEAVVGDVTRPEGQQRILKACPHPDILVNNAEGPPTGNFREWSRETWLDAVESNMVAPILLIKSVLDKMIERQWGRIINITSSAVKAPLPLLGLSNGARSGLTGFIAGLAREVAVDGVTINNLLPGRIETNRLRSYVGKVAADKNISLAEAAHQLAAANPMKRFGRPEEFGAFCAFLASKQASYITGQNILIDGGEFPGS